MEAPLGAGSTPGSATSWSAPWCYHPGYPVDGVVFAGTDGAGVFRWNPAQNVWAGANQGLPNNRVMALAASLDGTLAAATWGGGVALSTDRGASWSAMASGLASPYVRAVAFSPTYPGDRTLYAGTNMGAYRSSNGGASWTLLGTPADVLAATDITGFAITGGVPRTIFVSTGGKGIWQYTEEGATLASTKEPQRRLSNHANLGFHTFVPMVSKNRFGNVC